MAKKQTLEEGAESASSLSPQEMGAAYFEANPNCPVDSIFMCSDGTVFYDNPKGKNSLDNYLREAKEITATQVTK